MIGFLEGRVLELSADSGTVLLLVGGVGYQVFTLTSLVEALQVGEEARFYTYLHVREDALILFGLPTSIDVEFFKTLISVSGIGPKLALVMMQTFGSEHLAQAIGQEDIALLTKIPGIGKKTAERVVLDLKEKVGGFGMVATGLFEVDHSLDEVIEALVSLGYQRASAMEVAQKVPADITDLSARIAFCLKHIQ